MKYSYVVRAVLLIMGMGLSLITPMKGIAKSYYIAKSGNDNNIATEEAPWATLQKALNIANAGDLIIVKRGIYNENLNPINSGSSTSPITLKNYGNDNVILTSSGTTLILNGVSWWTISGVIFKDSLSGDQQILLKNGTNNIVFDNITISNGWGQGIAWWKNSGVSSITIKDSTIELNGARFAKTADDQLPDLGSGAGIFISHGENHLIKNNVIRNNRGKGISTDTESTGLYGMNIENNIIENNWSSGLDFHAIEGKVSGNIIKGNGHKEKPLDNDHWDKGLYMGSMSRNNIVKYNVFANNGTWEALIAGEGHVIHNNVFFSHWEMNTAARQVIRLNKGVTFLNNIVVQMLSGSNRHLVDIHHEDVILDGDFDYNLWYAPYNSTPFRSDETNINRSWEEWKMFYGKGENGLNTDPLFVDYANENFKLRQESHAIDAGIYMGDVYIGKGVDIGAFEHSITNNMASPVNLRIVK